MSTELGDSNDRTVRELELRLLETPVDLGAANDQEFVPVLGRHPHRALISAAVTVLLALTTLGYVIVRCADGLYPAAALVALSGQMVCAERPGGAASSGLTARGQFCAR